MRGLLKSWIPVGEMLWGMINFSIDGTSLFKNIFSEKKAGFVFYGLLIFYRPPHLTWIKTRIQLPLVP